MKAEDLMIGDYCRVWYEGLCIKNKGTIVKVLEIDAENRLKEKGLVGSAHCHPLDEDQFDGGIWCEYLDPIPLTAEILEKNGFAKSDKDADGAILYEYGNKYLGVSVWVNTKPCLFGAWRTWTDETQSYSMIEELPINHVHELQHCLKLCGISKEIVL